MFAVFKKTLVRKNLFIGVFMFSALFYDRSAFAKFRDSFLGLDIGGGSQTAYLTYTRPGVSGEYQIAMLQSSPSVAAYLQKPFDPTFQWSIFFLNFDWVIKVRQINLTNDPDVNQIKQTSYSQNPDGSTTAVELVPTDEYKLQLYGLDPSIYLQTGLAIPYLPWITLTIGLGYPVFSGALTLNNDRQQVTTHAPSLPLELELNLLRLPRLIFAVYASATPPLKTMSVTTKGEQGRTYKLDLFELGAGVRLLIKPW